MPYRFHDYPELFTNVGTINNSGIEITRMPVRSKQRINDNIDFVKTNKLVKFTNEEFQNRIPYRMAEHAP